ncbi:uncharacterized protein [Rutidosis leptorrhynchoides]|uniref:uncharacterized protein n=1 Tax=Rutidosis leptorrhynchoides TaxID=125765 RepID=UPI003A99F69D
MENAKPSSSAAPYLTGAGGKFRKPPISRKRPSTPYDRPSATTSNYQSNESQDGGWLSKLVVNPARRLIVGGATRILPSFFSKSEVISGDDSDYDSDCDRDLQDVDANVNADSDAKHTSEVGVSSFSRDAGPSAQMDKLKGSSQCNNVQQDESRNSIGDLGVDQIENMLKGKQFSRDESKRLMEILKSRLIDVSDTEGEKKTETVTFQEQDKADLLDREVRSNDVEKAVLETPMPHLPSNMQDEVAASPIDIARAYMGKRTSEVGINTYNSTLTGGKEQHHNDVFPSESQIHTPKSKLSTCWPGAMVQDQRGYMTPQSQRGGYGLHNFRQTPYSRTIYSKSKPKLNQLQGNSRPSNISLTPFQQSRTPNPWQMKTSSDVMDVGYGSVGPIRRVRNKFASQPQSEGPRHISSALISSSSTASRSFVPVFQTNPITAGTSDVHTLDNREQTFKEANPAGPSNDAVRKILERLDRHKPTPKEKAAELKLATEWRSSPSIDTNMMPKGSTVLQDLTGPSSVKGADGGTSFKASVTTSNAETKTKTKTSLVVDDASTGSVFGFKNTSVANEISTVTNNKEHDKSQKWSFDNQINGQDLTRKRPSQPMLKPISFKRPDPQQVISSDNGPGFTFPWSATANSASEPPTPSITPFLPATTVPQSNELPSIPIYSFGTNNSSERLVFRFQSSSSDPIDDSESDINFSFGLDKKRVSFSSIGSDAIVTK